MGLVVQVWRDRDFVLECGDVGGGDGVGVRGEVSSGMEEA